MRLKKRTQVFVAGILMSLMLVAVFVLLSTFALGKATDGQIGAATFGRLDVVGRLLIGAFLVINPLFALVGWASLALPASFRESQSGQIIIGVIYLLAFLEGWWLVGTLVGRFTGRQGEVRRDA